VFYIVHYFLEVDLESAFKGKYMLFLLRERR